MLAVALGLNVGYMLVEVAIGIIAGSLALLSDAAHMLTDAGAIALALVAARLAMRGPAGSMTFGYKRAEILSAQINGVTLLILGAVHRLRGDRTADRPTRRRRTARPRRRPRRRRREPRRRVALARANRESLNVEGAFQHNLMDAFASLATAAAAVVILLTGADRADAIASLIIAVPDAVDGGRLIKAVGARSSSRPRRTASTRTRSAARSWPAPGVREVHDLHVWEVTSGFPALTAHVLVTAASDCHAARRELEHDRRTTVRDRPHDAPGRPRGRWAADDRGRGEGQRQLNVPGGADAGSIAAHTRSRPFCLAV